MYFKVCTIFEAKLKVPDVRCNNPLSLFTQSWVSVHLVIISRQKFSFDKNERIQILEV